MKYISVDDLQAYCDNQKDHSITPNEFQRMNHIEIVRCKDCRFHKDEGERDSVPMWLPCAEIETDDDWFCGYGER